MAELNPYDTGERLEPHVWVNGEVVSPGGLPRRTTEDDYGRVDFDADDGTTILTLYIERADNGYTLNINHHGDDYLRVTGANRTPVLPGPQEAPTRNTGRGRCCFWTRRSSSSAPSSATTSPSAATN